MSVLPSYNFIDLWQLLPGATDKEALRLNHQSFDISNASTNSIIAQGNMSALKQTSNGQTSFWWGYATWVNLQQAPSGNQVVN